MATLDRGGGEADEVAGGLAPELRVDGEAQAGDGKAGRDGLYWHGVVEEHEARDAVDRRRREARIVQGGAARLERLRQDAATGAARERRVAHPGDRGAGGTRHAARNRSSVQSPWLT